MSAPALKAKSPRLPIILRRIRTPETEKKSRGPPGRVIIALQTAQPSLEHVAEHVLHRAAVLHLRDLLLGVMVVVMTVVNVRHLRLRGSRRDGRRRRDRDDGHNSKQCLHGLFPSSCAC